MLYSYLLVEKDFSLEPQPTSPTREKRFAYSLYLDLLVLMVRIAERVARRGGDRPLLDSRFVKGVMADDRMRSLMAKYKLTDFPFDELADSLADTVKASGLYKHYLKDSDGSLNSDVDIWRNIFNDIIFRDPKLTEAVARRENYSLRGVDRARELMDATFVNFYTSYGHIPEALSTLRRSLDAARELYFRLLLLPIQLTQMRAAQIDENRHKYFPTEEDRNPNMRFVENQLVEVMSKNPVIEEYCKANKLSWLPQDKFMMTALLKAIMESDLYKEYMSRSISDFHSDCEFWRNIFKQVIFRNENFLAELEDKSVFWNDDLEIMGTFLLKTLKRFDDIASRGEGPLSEEPVLAMYKDEEDARFGAELLSDAIKNKEQYREYIDEFVNKSQWDTERIPFMDMVVLLTAIAEIINFPKIPAQVSINEYIEIAKSYSSAKSAGFIHGLLGSVINKLNNEGVIRK